MSERPILKLKLPKSKPISSSNAASEQPTNPGTGKKLKIKFGGAKATKGGKSGSANAEKPANTESSPKIVFKKKGKKRGHEDDGTTNGAVPASANTIKRLKLTSKSTPKTPTTPFIRLKAKGKPPVKPMGIGYDSEASDAEVDPHIEEEFILRMQPGDDCEYVRNAIATKNWGPVSQGGADIKLKFLRHDGRRALLVVRGKMYAASMVDLPCIVEGMKSWDKKSWWKTADISQMLLVLGTVKSEEEALSVPLPEGDVRKGTFIYEHGLTPPMKWVRKRRFRKRVSTNIVMQVEQEVEDLFRRDAEAMSSEYKLQTWDEIEEEQRQQQLAARAEEEGYFDDADGEIDDQVQYEGEFEAADDDGEDAGDWEALMEEAEEQEESQTATPAPAPAAATASASATETSNGAHKTSVPIEAQPAGTDSEAATPGVTAVIDATDEADTPAGQDEDDADADGDGDESGSDADEDDDADEEDADEEELEMQQKRDEIADLERAIAAKVEDLARITNHHLRSRQAVQIRSLQEDLARQKAAIGEGDDDD